MAWISDYVQVGDVLLHYTRTGGDKPTVVLAHGITDSGLCWSAVARGLEETYDVVMVDARGHGRSSAPASGYTYSAHADDLAGFIAALGLDEPAVIGHSMGAGTALIAASRHPQRIRCILLEDPALRPPELLSAKEIAARTRQYDEHIAGYRQHTREELLAGVRRAHPNWSEEELEPWVEAKIQVRPQVTELISGPGLDWQTALPAVQCPVLLITADPELGAITTPEVAAQAADLWLCGQLVRIPGAGHCIHRDQLAAYMSAVNVFLRCV
jgi:pimeloyl-ACP methyl ester carboxylesterase